MNPAGIPLKEPSVSAAAGDTEQLERALIDASTRVPVLIFYTSAVLFRSSCTRRICFLTSVFSRGDACGPPI